MKRRLILVLPILLALLFSGCETTDTTTQNNENTEKTTTLTIKNSSFSDITEVKWNNIIFEPNELEKTIEIGNFVKKNVQPGYAYIYFKRKSNPIFARTKSIITIDEGENIEFIFTDNTLIVEQNNATNTGILSDLNSTVVFWDDAENELQKYDLFQADYSYKAYRNGEYSIFLDGGIIKLSVNLEKEAKISFWYSFASLYCKTYNHPFYFEIDDEYKIESSTSCSWSFNTFTLSAGEHTLYWRAPTCGHVAYGEPDKYGKVYLDDILIAYTN